MPLEKEPLNIVIAGVGGQGNILASELVATAGVNSGYQVTVGEIYGASQRGGAVMSHVRFSTRERYGALIPAGGADVILGFEPLETMRILKQFGNPSTKVICNSRFMIPISVLVGDAKYPSLEELVEAMNKMAASVTVVEATELARQAGNTQSTNVVMVGCLSGSGALPYPPDTIRQILPTIFSGARLELNLKAFDSGYAAVAGVHA